MDAKIRSESSPETGLRPSVLRAELESLRRAGAPGYDAPGFSMIERLLDHAESLGEPACWALFDKVQVRLTALGGQVRADRAEAEVAMAHLEARGVDVETGLREAFDQGDWRRVCRAAQRLGEDRSDVFAVRRGQREAYRGAAADFSAVLGLAAVRDAPPVQPGLLNGTLLAVRVLEEAERFSPRYRQHLVAELIDLAALMGLPPRATPRKRR